MESRVLRRAHPKPLGSARQIIAPLSALLVMACQADVGALAEAAPGADATPAVVGDAGGPDAFIDDRGRVDAGGRVDAARVGDATVISDADSVDADPSDADPPDAGPNDAGPIDSGEAPTDAGVPPGGQTANCPVPTLDTLFAGRLPPNPFRYDEPATPCVSDRHDVIIVLGCPTENDGTASRCLIRRADLAVQLRDAGYGDRFIVTGGAVANAFVEAHALRDLLVARNVSAASIELEPNAQHTDENIAYSTTIMEAEGWVDALIVTESPGHLIMTAVCDSACCVKRGRLTPFMFEVGGGESVLAGHYVRHPWSDVVTDAECDHIRFPTKAMCTQLASRLACMP